MSGTTDSTVKRLRWATQRHKGQAAVKKRRSIFKRHREKQNADLAHTGKNFGGQMDPDAVVETGQAQRRVYVNQQLPPDELDEDGHPKAQFARNKIRTAKYTPLSFVPKNLWLQLHNVANIFFVFVAILAAFSIFGASNAFLGVLPILAILLITAIKDAIEDYRRTILDLELNNTPVHLLVDWHNVNVTDDQISVWRRVKKATTRGMKHVWHFFKHLNLRKKNSGESFLEADAAAAGLERTQTRASIYSTTSEGAESFQMTPVHSPSMSVQGERFSYVPGDDGLDGNGEVARYNGSAGMSSSHGGLLAVPGKVNEHAGQLKQHGSLIDPFLQGPGTAKFKREHWKNVRVGDFVRIYNNDQVPADVVILSTSDTDGACYVETKNLDGETNLKVRHALHCGTRIRHAKDCERAQFVIESEAPHANLYAYSAVVRWMEKDARHPEKQGVPMSEPVSINNLLLRGCSLRNTDWAIGIVVFTGIETKIMINAGVTPTKRSRISRELNINVYINFGILLIMCFLSGLINGIYYSKSDESWNFFEFGSIGGSAPVDGIVTFWTTVILFQTLVPISLYISLEIIKSAQAYFIYCDTFMYYDVLDYPCTPKSWNISDDLGQIEYIFSDKTGTLTQNIMEFKKCTINGVPYGEAYTEAQAGAAKRQGVNVEEQGAKIKAQIAADKVEMLNSLRETSDNPYLLDDNLTFVAPDFVRDLNGHSGEVQAKANFRFMLALSLCHSVLPDYNTEDPPTIEFKAQSPDEAALVSTARDVGFSLTQRTQAGVVVNVQGVETEYQVLHTLEFNSARKRMSAIVRMPDGKIVLFCKGADSIIYSRLVPDEQPELRRSTAEHLEMFAREGFRTLCVSERELSNEEYQEWLSQYEAAAEAMTGRDEKIEEVSEMIENQLTLLGGTAIEDRLQDGVPESISLLAEAGIKLWVLTGDKVETAINIGFSCNLLDNNMDLILVQPTEQTVENAHTLIRKHLYEHFNLQGGPTDLKNAKKDHDPPPPTHALVIDGSALELVLQEDVKDDFLLLCKQCKAVLCCRVSPSQKAAVVQMVKNGLDVMTLAIGDGANDVAMIQEADVGVGIAGEEGRQAAMSSDYAIGQFRFLSRLVLVHGRWSYRRLAESIANFFYKNIVWTFALFWYQIYCNFDGSYLFDYTYVLLYNLAFTSLPVMLMGILDQDVDDKISLAIPQLYQRGILRLEWTQTKFWIYMIDGIYQSLICFFSVYFIFYQGQFATENGLSLNSQEQMGVYVASAVILVVNIYVLINQYRWDWLFLLIVTISTLLIWFWTGVFSQTDSNDNFKYGFYHVAQQVYGALSYWATILLAVVTCLLPRFACKVVQKLYFPYDIDIIREQVRQGKYQYLYDAEGTVASLASSASMSSISMHKPRPSNPFLSEEDEERPIYPPSIAPTARTDKRDSQHSDGTAPSDILPPQNPFAAMEERPRNSFERVRMSLDRARPSFELSNDYTSAAMLARIESRNSYAFSRRPCALSHEVSQS